jgi:hypothetical protein
MKTIHLLCSLIIIVAMTLSLGGIYPPSTEVHAEMTASKAAGAPEKPKVDNVSAQPETPAIAPPAQSTQRILTEHQTQMQAAGIAEADWNIAEDIIGRESGWCATKWEGEIGYCPAYHGVPGSGGYGLCQSTPPQKMASMGPGWETDPVVQLKWCAQYAQGYGSWSEAKKFRDCLGSCYSTRTHNVQYKKTTWF